MRQCLTSLKNTRFVCAACRILAATVQKRMINKDNSNEATLQVQVGKKIEQQRTLLRRTTKEMATALGMSDVAYRNIERGITDITVRHIMKIANTLQIHYTQILDIDKSEVYTINSPTESKIFYNQSYNNDLAEGYKTAIEQYKSENTHLRKQLRELTEVLRQGKK